MDPVEDIDEEFCTQCNMAFPTLNDCLIVHGQRYCQECAMLIMTAKPSSNGSFVTS
jgi:hypothetical protein